MKSLAIILMSLLSYPSSIPFISFENAKSSGQWYIVNDDVMGGVSSSKFVLNSNKTATFSGNLSPENNGGFASIRTRLDQDLDADLTGVHIKMRGDGNKYSLRFRTSNRFDGYSYQATVQTEKGAWTEFKVPFSEFKPTFRGYTLRDKPELVSENIKQMGILIADKQWGEFTVDVDWIKFY